METKGIGVMGRGKREGGGGEGDCSKREGEAKGIDARGGLYAQATTFYGTTVRSVFTAKRRSLVEGNECKRDLRTTVRLLRKLMVTTMELQIMVFRCETYGRLAAPRVWI